MDTTSLEKEWRAEWDSNPRFPFPLEAQSQGVSDSEGETRTHSLRLRNYASYLTEERVLRFWSKVKPSYRCWLWTGNVRGTYGRFAIAHLPGHIFIGMPAHRLAYELVFGAIPEGLKLDHLCSNMLCVNPFHLEPVTHRENIQRAWDRLPRPDVCKDGHARPAGTKCRECARRRQREWLARQRQKQEQPA